jgi:hypothetical protein
MKIWVRYLLGLSVVLWGCRTARVDFDPNRLYPTAELQEDMRTLQQTIEAHHPGLYWYQSQAAWKAQWAKAEIALDKPMSEPEFRKLIRPLVSSIRCGHTSVRVSKNWQRYQDTTRIQKLFPISVRCWADTMIVVGNLDPTDSLLVRGSQVLSINGRSAAEIYKALFPYIFGDGFNETHKYQTLSGWGSFGSYYRSYLDSSSSIKFEILDSLGNRHLLSRSLFTPKPDTARRQRAATQPLTKKEKRIRRIEGARKLQIDVREKQALMRINTFSQGGRLRSFFKKGFKLLNENKIEDLIIDVRNNGGGRVGNSTSLSRYLTDHPFKIADSLYAIRRSSRYGRYIVHNTAIQASMPFLTRKRKDGFYHFGYFERHWFKPKEKNNYTGRVYILTGGYSFSATTLFVNAVKGQKNVTVIGEETGGGAYGNSAWEIPELVLPNTKVRVRLPLFRMVMDKQLPNNGRGIMPDIEVSPTVESVRRNFDNKFQAVNRLIQENRRKRS